MGGTSWVQRPALTAPEGDIALSDTCASSSPSAVTAVGFVWCSPCDSHVGPKRVVRTRGAKAAGLGQCSQRGNYRTALASSVGVHRRRECCGMRQQRPGQVTFVEPWRFDCGVEPQPNASAVRLCP